MPSQTPSNARPLPRPPLAPASETSYKSIFSQPEAGGSYGPWQPGRDTFDDVANPGIPLTYMGPTGWAHPQNMYSDRRPVQSLLGDDLEVQNFRGIDGMSTLSSHSPSVAYTGPYFMDETRGGYAVQPADVQQPTELPSKLARPSRRKFWLLGGAAATLLIGGGAGVGAYFGINRSPQSSAAAASTGAATVVITSTLPVSGTRSGSQVLITTSFAATPSLSGTPTLSSTPSVSASAQMSSLFSSRQVLSTTTTQPIASSTPIASVLRNGTYSVLSTKLTDTCAFMNLVCKSTLTDSWAVNSYNGVYSIFSSLELERSYASDSMAGSVLTGSLATDTTKEANNCTYLVAHDFALDLKANTFAGNMTWHRTLRDACTPTNTNAQLRAGSFCDCQYKLSGS